MQVAIELGVRIAPRDNPEKLFAPTTKGVVLGIFYDTERWVWAYPQIKLVRLLHSLKVIIKSDPQTQREIWSIAGKILHVFPLIPGGRFNLYHLIKANGVSTVGTELVNITPALKRQLLFWIAMLRVCNNEVDIPRPHVVMPPWSL